MEKRVGIVGAGISGLLACKYALQKGFDPLVFEADSGIGGVWAHTAETTKLQSPRPSFEFSDFPWPPEVQEMHPHNGQVLSFLSSYAKHFDLFKHIKFNTRVMGVEYVGHSTEEMNSWELWAGNGEGFGDGRGTWRITVQCAEDDPSTQVYEVDFLVLCLGRFSGLPNIPSFPPNKGPEVFKGQVLHSMDYSNMSNSSAAELVKGKRVTVVGAMKSAVDIAAECSNANGTKYPCTLLRREDYWILPHFFAWGLPLQFFYFNRFSELLVHKPSEGLLLKFLATILSPLRWILSKLAESYFLWKLPLRKYDMVPAQSFSYCVSTCKIANQPDRFYERIEEGSIVPEKTKTFTFCENGVVTGEGKLIETDLVIFGTGFKGDEKIRDLFKSPEMQEIVIGTPDTVVPLYRECLHPRIPQLAVLDYSECLWNVQMLELRARWLAEFLSGSFRIPNVRRMEEDVLEWEKYFKRYCGSEFRRASMGSLHIWYYDQLCRDMGYNPRRKGGFFADLFLPYLPIDYKDLSSCEKSCS